MEWRRGSWTWLWILLAAMAGARASPAATAAPAPPDAEEGWLGLAVLDELKRCEGGQAWGRLGKRLEGGALARLACGRLDRMGSLVDLTYGIRACTYLPLLEKAEGGRALALWLLDHREVSRRLFRALGEAGSVEEALGRFAELHAAEGDGLAAWPDLAVALATSQPLEHYRQQPDPPSLVECFRYYARSEPPFVFDLKHVPYELLRYLADTRATVSDREWADATYRLRDPGTVYNQVEYDMGHFKRGRAKQIDSVPYSLPNLARLGGVCLDRAYFAAEVCKAQGMPATIVHGHGSEGVEHAWFAYCRKSTSDGSPVWISRGGRGEEPMFFMGLVRNPADGKMILDAELMLLGGSAQLPLDAREEADAAVALARLADAASDRKAEADLSCLRELGETYRKRLAAGGGASAPQTAWIAARRQIDLSLVEDLLSAAIRRDLACRAAWKLLLELRKSDRLPVEDLGRFFRVLIDRTAGAYPEYSCLMVLQIVPTIDDAEYRQKVYERAITVYGQRPDLKGRLRIALGDDYRTRGANDKALETYRAAAREGVQLAEVVVQAARRAEELLLAAGRQDEAVGLYRDLFRRTRPWRIATAFRNETSHFQLGSRLAELLSASGRAEEARKVRSQL